MENAEELSLYRATLRRNCLAMREALDDAQHAALSQQVAAHLGRLLTEYGRRGNNSATVGFCLPMRKEFDARPLVADLLAHGWQAAVPVVSDKQAPMAYRRWTPDCALAVDAYGLPVPATDERLQPSLVLLPLVGFDDAGYRLGYGGGHFDRTLAAQSPRPYTVGVGFESARVATIRPQTHDIPLSAVVTEAGVLYHVEF